jgi:large subunit ribosomal protein L23
MRVREIILRPLITEKTTLMQERENTVCFEVDRRANKIMIRKAVEELFDVRVTGVNIVNLKGKPVMKYGRTVSHRPATCKAYVKLAEGSKTLEFFEGI